VAQPYVKALMVPFAEYATVKQLPFCLTRWRTCKAPLTQTVGPMTPRFMSSIERTEVSPGSGRRLARLVFFVMLSDSLRYVTKTLEPRLERIEQKGPK
jgi:hypothetical protein